MKDRIFINKIKEHPKIKKILLKQIQDTPKSCFEKISFTDWKMPSNIERPYFEETFKTILKKYYLKISKKLYGKHSNIIKLIIHNYWFQMYDKDSTHVWHTHAERQFTNVYFLELSNKKYATNIFGIKNLNVREGDLLTFPSYLLHRSPVNKTNERKTIISFNTSFDSLL